MKVKRISVFLCLISLIMILTVCSDKQKNNKLATLVTDPVKEINCIKPSAMPTLLDACDGNILVCWSDYEEKITHLRIVNIAGDTITASLDLEGCLDLFPESFTNHGFVLRDSANSRWLFLDAKLKVVDEFPVESMDGFFTHDRSEYYYLNDSVLYCLSTACGDACQVNLPYNLRFSQIAGFHQTKNTIALHVYTSPFSTECGTAIIELDSGTFSMVQSTVYQTTFGEEYIKLLHFDEKSMQYDVTFCGSESTKHIPAAQFSQNGELVSICNADYLIEIGDSTELFRLTSSGMASCSLTQNGIIGEFRDICWTAKSRLLVGSVWKGSSATIYAVCPELLSFTEIDVAQSVETPIKVDDNISKNYWGKLSGDSLPESMNELRNLANKIEQTYDVQILLSEQCQELAQYCNFKLVLTNVMSEADEMKRIGYFLSSLENSLSMYPDGFFTQFRSIAGDGGICFMPVEQIISDKGVIGVCYEGSNWYAIALDVKINDMASSICHEIWHATENKILSEDYAAFEEKTWAKFNPDGFRYNENMEQSDAISFQWTLFDDAHKVYFIDEYARTNSKEDRARLMEYVMKKPEYRKRIKSSPALVSKLQYMSNVVKKHFDTTKWIDTTWEI